MPGAHDVSSFRAGLGAGLGSGVAFAAVMLLAFLIIAHIARRKFNTMLFATQETEGMTSATAQRLNQSLDQRFDLHGMPERPYVTKDQPNFLFPPRPQQITPWQLRPQLIAPWRL